METLNGFELFKQGAEGRIFKGTYLGKSAIAKERFKKKYRHPDLDTQLTKERMKSECRAIIRCKTVGIRTAAIYLVDFKCRTIFMEYFEHSISAKEFIFNSQQQVVDKVAFKIGEILGKMHANNIVHGDLTSSNILLVNRKNEDCFENVPDLDVVFIDFGLAHTESSSEDKGVDLYVLERALISTHSTAEAIFEKIIDGYSAENKKGCKEVFHKFEEVRARGRKRTMIG